MKFLNKVLILLIILCLFYVVLNKYLFKIQDAKAQVYSANYINNTSTVNKIKLNKIALKQRSIEYNAVIEIPKLKLKRGIYEKANKENNIQKNITLIYPNNFKNVENEIIVLAAHSGNAKISYFHNLDKLDENDRISLYIDGYKYQYKIIKKYEILKTGELPLIYEQKSRLYLTTCSEKNKEKQLVILAELDKIKNY